jgi:hypothetical protein
MLLGDYSQTAVLIHGQPAGMAYYWRAVACSTGRPKVGSLARGNGSRGLLSRGSLAEIPRVLLWECQSVQLHWPTAMRRLGCSKLCYHSSGHLRVHSIQVTCLGSVGNHRADCPAQRFHIQLPPSFPGLGRQIRYCVYHFTLASTPITGTRSNPKCPRQAGI